MTLGQEFGGFAANVAHAAKELERSSKQLLELNLGSTALGTGHQRRQRLHHDRGHRNLASYTGAAVRPAVNRFRVTQSMGDVLGYSGALRRLASEVGKIASDLRLLSMGPRAGIAEIRLPAVQPGSSIMPGKVNPSVPEMVNQVVLPGVRLRRDDPRGRRGRPAGAQRDDAGHRLECDSCHPHPRTVRCRCCSSAASPESRPTRSAAASCSIAAPRSRPRSVPTSATPRPRTSRRPRSRPAVDPRARARARPAVRRAAGSRPVRGSDDRSRACPAATVEGRQDKCRHGKTDRSTSHWCWPPRPPSARSRGSTAGCSVRSSSGTLEGPDRDAWQRPDQVMDKLLIAERSVVADLGAGGGWFTIRLASRVGPNGIVYAEDVQPQMIEAITRRTARAQLTNVRTVLGTSSDPRLPATDRRRADRRRLPRDGTAGA